MENISRSLITKNKGAYSKHDYFSMKLLVLQFWFNWPEMPFKPLANSIKKETELNFLTELIRYLTNMTKSMLDFPGIPYKCLQLIKAVIASEII